MADKALESHLSTEAPEGNDVAAVRQHHRMATGQKCNGMGTSPNGGAASTERTISNSKVNY